MDVSDKTRASNSDVLRLNTATITHLGDVPQFIVQAAGTQDLVYVESESEEFFTRMVCRSLRQDAPATDQGDRPARRSVDVSATDRPDQTQGAAPASTNDPTKPGTGSGNG